MIRHEIYVIKSLKTDEELTITDLQEIISKKYEVLSNTLISSALGALIDKGLVERTLNHNRAFFKATNEGKAKIPELEKTARREEFSRSLKVITPIDDVVEKFEQEFRVDDSTTLIEAIASDKKKLAEYLKKISNLETNIYELKNRHVFLEKKVIDVSADVEPPEEIEKKVFTSMLVKPVLPVKHFSEPQKPQMEKPGIFNKKKVEEENQKKIDDYNQALETYNSKMAEFNELMQKYNDDEATYNASYKKEQEDFLAEEERVAEDNKKEYENRLQEAQSIVLKEVEVLENQLAQTIKARNELYSAGVIYNKYRNDVAVATFYDYLMSGRCTTLEGPDGAYNLFESELRQDIIICQLDAALVALDKIQKNQYYLYEQLERANRSLDLINEQLLLNNAIGLAQLDVLNSINANTQVAAFYSKKNAELTDALGFMIAMR